MQCTFVSKPASAPGHSFPAGSRLDLCKELGDEKEKLHKPEALCIPRIIARRSEEFCVREFVPERPSLAVQVATA